LYGDRGVTEVARVTGSIHLADAEVDKHNVRNGSNALEWFRVRVGTGTGPLKWALPHENPDSCKLARFITKIPAFQHPNIRSNRVFWF
jgi:hypothetical protein